MNRFLLLAACFSSAFALARIEPRLLVNGGTDAKVEPLAPALLEMQYFKTDEEGKEEVVKDIKVVMGKSMHLIVVKSDLSTFAHFHPFFDQTTGWFQAPIHLKTAHPDNQAATTAFPEAGEYLIYTEVKSIQNGILIHGLNRATSGEGVTHTLIPDARNETGAFVHYIDADGNIAAEGARYRAVTRVIETPGVGGDLISFAFRLEQKQEDGSYQEVGALEPWLGMAGHAILLGSLGDKATERVFAHEHSHAPIAGGKLRFTHFARGGLPRDTYRLWMQMKHDGRVLTVPLTFAYPF